MQQIGQLKPATAVPANAIEIGRVDTHGASNAQWGAVVNDAKSKARELGGDAIIIKSWGSPVVGVGGYGEVYNGKEISCSVIRYSP